MLELYSMANVVAISLGIRKARDLPPPFFQWHSHGLSFILLSIYIMIHLFFCLLYSHGQSWQPSPCPSLLFSWLEHQFCLHRQAWSIRCVGG